VVAPALGGVVRVLVVEDNPADEMLLRAALMEGAMPVELECVARLQDALEQLGKGRFDVVLSDLSLPDSHGIETFQRLAEHPARVPVVVLSGLDDEALALRTVEMGAQDYLVKGRFDAGLLTRALRYAITRAEAERRLGQERALLRNVIDNLPDAIYVKDAGGRFLLDNVAHMRLVGAGCLEDVVGKTPADFFPAEVARELEREDAVVLESGQSVVNRHGSREVAGHGVRWFSSTKVPMRDAVGEVVGVIGIDRDITARKLAEEQLGQYMEELREKNAEMEDDLNMAREVQQAFFPQQFPSFPRRCTAEKSGLRFHSRYLPTATLGGDFFHVGTVAENCAGIFICDAMGHGVRAALITAIERALVEELVEFAAQPGEFLARMNASLVSILRRTRSPMFVSAFYLVVDLEGGVMRYANAGHPSPLHVRRGAGVVELLNSPRLRPGPALGVFDGSRYQVHERRVEAGDLVFLYTDGLYEVEGSSGDFYDQAALVRGVQGRVGLGTEELFEQTLGEVQQFSCSGTFIDDVCLVGVEIQRVGLVPAEDAGPREPGEAGAGALERERALPGA